MLLFFSLNFRHDKTRWKLSHLPCSETSRVQHDAEAQMFGWYGDERLEFVSFFSISKNSMQLCKSFFCFFFNLKFQQIGWSKRTFRHAYIAWRLGAQTGSSTSHSNWRVCFSTGFLGRWLAWPLWLMTSYAMGLIIFRTKSTFLKLCSNTSWSLLRHWTLFHFTSQAEIETKSTCATPDSRGGFISSAFACCWNESNLQFLDRSDMHLTYLQIRVILKSIGFLIKQTFPNMGLMFSIHRDLPASRALKAKAWWSLMYMHLHPWSWNVSCQKLYQRISR